MPSRLSLSLSPSLCLSRGGRKPKHIQELPLSKMLRAVSFFSRKKTSRPFKDFYIEWIETLKNALLPLLRGSISSSSLSPNLLSDHVEKIHQHFQDYYDALDLAASNDVSQLLYPEWRSSIEKPFLWLGDFHPYLYTSLIRSFLVEEEEDENEDDSDVEIGQASSGLLNKPPWHIAMAWKNPSKTLMGRIEQTECALRLMVPALMARVRSAQARFVNRVAVDWARCEGRKEGNEAFVTDAMNAHMDEMMGAFVDANRLRKSVLAEIMAATDVYQAALFLERLAQFLIVFRDDELLSEFEHCNVPID